jgi:hypothetical protein
MFGCLHVYREKNIKINWKIFIEIYISAHQIRVMNLTLGGLNG